MRSLCGSLICLSIFKIATAVEVMESELNYIIIGVIRPKRKKQEKKERKRTKPSTSFSVSWLILVFRFGKRSGLPVLYGVAEFYLMD